MTRTKIFAALICSTLLAGTSSFAEEGVKSAGAQQGIVKEEVKQVKADHEKLKADRQKLREDRLKLREERKEARKKQREERKKEREQRRAAHKDHKNQETKQN